MIWKKHCHCIECPPLSEVDSGGQCERVIKLLFTSVFDLNYNVSVRGRNYLWPDLSAVLRLLKPIYIKSKQGALLGLLYGFVLPSCWRYWALIALFKK